MSVAASTLTERESVIRQIDKLVSSDVLHGSESLCKLLRYLAERSIASPGASVKEYQIATEVFGRPSGFDPRLDSTVRVQTGRLRSKLSEYYALQGREDALVVDLPKGSYALTFHPRSAIEPSVANTAILPAFPPVERPAPARSAPSSTPWMIAAASLGVLLAITASALLYMVLSRPTAAAATHDEPEPAPYFRSFWRNFTGQEQPWVVFSNAEFVGRPETGLRYFDAERDTRDRIFDHYTGVGEVLAVHELDRVFAALHHGLRIKRGRLLNLDDIKNNDIIFVGSPSENLTLREIPTTHEFTFNRVAQGGRRGDLQIRNLHPRPGEGPEFLSVGSYPMTEDYALIAVFPGINPAHSVMILAGITTLGTEAAVEFVSRAKSVEELVNRVGLRKNGIAPFEAVLRVRVRGGVPVESDLVALHPAS